MKSFHKQEGNLRAEGGHYIDSYGNEGYSASIVMADETHANAVATIAEWRKEGSWILRFLPYQVFRPFDPLIFIRLARYGQEQLDEYKPDGTKR